MAKIQFEDKVALNENTSIQDINKCKATDLNEIKSVVNGNDDLVGDLSTLNTTNKSSIVGSINEVYQNNIYSSDEKIIGKWIDGKPIYRKVLSGTKASIIGHLNQSEIGYETVIKAYGIMYSIWDNWWYFPTYFTDSAYFIVTYYTTERIVIEHGANYNANSPIRFIIEYTKTTD